MDPYHLKAAALNALDRRRANRPEQLDNSALYAGSPIYFYCQSCGWIADTMPEDYFLSRPRRLCSECQAMKDLGWLDVP